MDERRGAGSDSDAIVNRVRETNLRAGIWGDRGGGRGGGLDGGQER